MSRYARGFFVRDGYFVCCFALCVGLLEGPPFVFEVGGGGEGVVHGWLV